MRENEKSMYYGATTTTFEKARQLRINMTKEESILWEKLKGKQICNVRFRRQHPIHIFIADFYCHSVKLVVELDGKIHLPQKEYDKERTEILNEFGINIIRFTNEEIESNLDKVIQKIISKVKSGLEYNI